MYKFADVIHDAQLQRHGITHIEKAILDNILVQINSRKSNRMILFTVPQYISNHLTTDKQKIDAVESVMRIFADKADIVCIWSLGIYLCRTYEYCNLSKNNVVRRIVSSHDFAIRFKDCHYDELNEDNGKVGIEFVENLKK